MAQCKPSHLQQAWPNSRWRLVIEKPSGVDMPENYWRSLKEFSDPTMLKSMDPAMRARTSTLASGKSIWDTIRTCDRRSDYRGLRSKAKGQGSSKPSRPPSHAPYLRVSFPSSLLLLSLFIYALLTASTYIHISIQSTYTHAHHGGRRP